MSKTRNLRVARACEQIESQIPVEWRRIPEVALWLRVLADAIHAASGVSGWQAHERQPAARHWIEGEGLIAVAELLGLDGEWVREVALQVIAEESGLALTPHQAMAELKPLRGAV